MPISIEEQKMYEEKIHLLNELDLERWASESFSDKQFRLVFIKAMNNLIGAYVQESTRNFKLTDDSLLDDKEFTKNVLEKTLLNLVKVAADEPKEVRTVKIVKGLKGKAFKEYTTGQLATFFGVSTTTINNWINEGRFLLELEDGRMVTIVRKTQNERLRIHPTAWFDAPAGVRYQIKDLVEAYEEDNKEWKESKKFNTVDENEQIRLYLEHFKNKYDGDFNTIFGEKNWDELTPEQETDAAMWSFFLQRINDGKDARDY